MKMHKINGFQPSVSPDSPWGAMNQDTHHGIWGAGTFAVT